MALLEISGLEVGYGSLGVLRGIDFVVEEGETCVLFGLNGAGKTTTVTTIAGLLKPWKGSVRFDGQDIGGKPTAKLVDMGISLSPEGRRIFPRLTVTENLTLGAWVRRKDSASQKRQRELIYHYFPRLSERETQVAGTLSGGEQQMLAIGRALMSSPRLLLVDEASLGLSPTVAKLVFKAMKQVNLDGVTVVLVEQNAGVLPYADRALIMEQGRLVYTGVGEEIRNANLRETYLGGEGGH